MGWMATKIERALEWGLDSFERYIRYHNIMFSHCEYNWAKDSLNRVQSVASQLKDISVGWSRNGQMLENICEIMWMYEGLVEVLTDLRSAFDDVDILLVRTLEKWLQEINNGDTEVEVNADAFAKWAEENEGEGDWHYDNAEEICKDVKNHLDKLKDVLMWIEPEEEAWREDE
jgi:hypothetical protein